MNAKPERESVMASLKKLLSGLNSELKMVIEMLDLTHPGDVKRLFVVMMRKGDEWAALSSDPRLAGGRGRGEQKDRSTINCRAGARCKHKGCRYRHPPQASTPSHSAGRGRGVPAPGDPIPARNRDPGGLHRMQERGGAGWFGPLLGLRGR